MNVIDAQQVAKCLSMKSLIETMRETYAQPAALPQRRVMPLEEGKYEAFALLPAWNQDLIAVKAFTYFPQNPVHGKDTLASKILVFNREDGQPVALVDGKVLTFWRYGSSVCISCGLPSARKRFSVADMRNRQSGTIFRVGVCRSSTA